MKKIMFNKRYGLTEAVLQGRKTMTRRLVKNANLLQWLHEMEVAEYSIKGTIVEEYSPYKVGEVVAIAQSYQEAINEFNRLGDISGWGNLIANTENGCAGYYNKMFVRADLMPHHIRITDLKAERLRDISEEDCLKEGIIPKKLDYTPAGYPKGLTYYGFDGWGVVSDHAKDAFAALIDKVSGRGTWDRNPWVFAYSYELVK